MINGFVLEVTNENEIAIDLAFFQKMTLPAGVRVIVINSSVEYQDLYNLAISKGFKGSGISTDDERINSIAIFENNVPAYHDFHKLLDGKKIIIDGDTHYISLRIPPISKSIIQLLPIV